VAENAAGGEGFPRWLARDDVDLVEELKRENVTGANEG
jgi:hypothetical protein